MASIAVPAQHKRYTGLLSWITTTDHKKVGILYLVTTFIFFLVGGLMAEVIRVHLAVPHDNCYPANCGIVSQDTYDQLFTMHGSIMIFLWIIPVWVGFANFMLPLMIGARDMAFPRLNAFSYWLIPIAGGLMLTGYFQGGMANSGWTAYPPLSSKLYSPGIGQDYWILGLHLLGISSIMGAVNIIVTILTLRTRGMTIWRMPIFVWTTLITAFLTLVTSPVLAANLAMLLMDRQYGTHFFTKGTGDPVLWQYLFWFYSHPAVYIMILPAMAVISEVIPVFSKKTIFGYKAIAFSSVAIALVGFFVWAHHMFVAGMSTFAAAIFSFLTFFIAIPSAIKVFNWIATMWEGSIELKTPMLYAISFLSLFTIGGLTGLFLASLSTDVHLHDTYFIVAHFHYVMAGSNLIALLAGLHYWWPKMFGRMYNESVARVGCVLVFIGFNATFIPQFVLGSRGMPRRYYNYLPQFQALHVASTIGAMILAIGLFLTLANLLASFRRAKGVPDNPWGGKTLEWSTSSPPPTHNFVGQPVPLHGPYDYRPVPVRIGSEHHTG